MTGYRWIRVTTCGAIPPREGRAVHVGGRNLAIFNLGDRFVAIDARCPHKGGPLADGLVSGASVVCPLHAWKIDLVSGGVLRPGQAPECVATYPVLVDQGIVAIGLPEAEGDLSPGAAAPPCGHETSEPGGGDASQSAGVHAA